MKKLRNSFFIKVICIIICSVTLFLSLCGAFGTLLMLNYKVYTENPEKVLNENLEDIAFEYAWDIGNSTAGWLIYDDGKVYGEGHITKTLVPYLENSFPSVYFEVLLPDGTVLLTNYNGEDFRFQRECTDRVSIKNETGKIVLDSDTVIYYDTTKTDQNDSVDADEGKLRHEATEIVTFDEPANKYFDTSDDFSREELEETESADNSYKSYNGDEKEILTEICTKVYVKKIFEDFDKMYLTERLITALYRIKYVCPVLTVFLFFVSLLLLIFILYSAGYKNTPKTEKNGAFPTTGIFDRIPFDIVTAFYLFLAILEAFFFSDFIAYCNTGLEIFLTLIVVYADILLILAYLYTFAVRCKTSTLWKNTVIYRISKFILKALSKLFSFLGEVIKGLPLVYKTILGIGAVIAAEALAFFLCILWQADGRWLIFWWFIENIILIPIIIYIVIQMKKLKKGCREISSGNFSYKIDTAGMPSELREHGENLNSISVGMASAVEEKLRSERLKTELITNVSHDLKTPLTSIINYVDLLKKEEPENEKSKEYISVLERQSSRLKKLLSDLIDASKASTGNIPVNLTNIDSSVLLGQVLGEWETRIKEAGLELILTKPEYSLYLTGDGNLLWRILDNLMNNICKYAQSGTRVYVNLEDFGDKVSMVFKNISKYPLNISEEELMERFVRADSSRSTEGSGLGLSIAQSLTSLQGGVLALSVDGDLFKATVDMKKAQKTN